MKIGIFTHYSLDPKHPRTEMISGILIEAGHKVDIYNFSSKKLSYLNKILLIFFDLDGIRKANQKLDIYDLIIIQGLRYLPLARKAREKGKKVIYETLDQNVYLRYNQLVKKSILFRLFFFIPNIFVRLEKYYARKYTDSIIVNSKQLKSYFKGRARTIYYSSPLEGIFMEANKPPAFLHLGALVRNKGADQILDIVGRYNLNLYVFGGVFEDKLGKKIKDSPNIIITDRLAIPDLLAKLSKIMSEYSLLGFSLIQEVHKSYMTGEANKEIDYLSMGVPFIGNFRNVTKVKLDAGCGVFHTDAEGIQKLIEDPDIRSDFSKKCQDYYQENFSNAKFKRDLLEVIEQVR